jgi:hypothetical protein
VFVWDSASETLASGRSWFAFRIGYTSDGRRLTMTVQSLASLAGSEPQSTLPLFVKFCSMFDPTRAVEGTALLTLH